ncbi:F-box domain protein [Aspergillus saccharolyticus JOP 1030-1]|uniref:F-box domain-containing protein n=1 Tax=Aspergillus saccharolyticus JOP 1030-1 TaxID=1450539 RepID=A0A318ZK68_9EURO|nr:hypothetical protein BP01DRAFT_422080 [Aspergillus saccharolyticus JOP 1030-1]PYH47247.1 hypothetical protein BP01DRAFT_422080 [Aspergillus saccharolyticus JOP 1030-1]
MSLHPTAIDNATVQQIIALFNSLSTQSARRAAYWGILDELNSPEWGDVRTHIKQRTFQKDILGESLPEIILQIVQYLSVSDLYVLQRVSRRWHSLLSSDSTRRTLYRLWTNESSAHLRAADFTRYAQRRIRLERGQPAAYEPRSIVLHHRTLGGGRADFNSYDIPSPATLAYAHGRYAWLRQPDVLVIDNIRNSTRQQLCTENRDRFQLVGISSSVVVAISTRAYCHVWSLGAEEHAWFRIPSSNVTGFAVRDITVAVAYRGSTLTESGERIDRDSVVYWDMRSRAAHTIENVPQVALLDLYPAKKSLIIVHVERQETYQVCVRKYSMDGQGQAYTQRSYASLKIPRDWSFETLSRSWDKSHHRFAVFFVQSPLDGTATRSFQWVIAAYDPQMDEVALHKFNWNDKPYHFLRAAVVDRNLLYYLREDHGSPALWISDLSAQPPHRATRAMFASYQEAGGFLLGDREFVLLAHQTGIQVWFFDDDPSVKKADFAAGPQDLMVPSRNLGAMS